MRVSILICSFIDSNYLSTTVKSIIDTFPKEYNMELLIDYESKKTGLKNTANRYMKLFEQSTGDIIVKSDDDVMYYKGCFENCLDIVLNRKNIGYCSPISHSLMLKLKIRHAQSNMIPVKPKGFNMEPTLSGMCWVFKRSLWNKYPYNLADTWHLDDRYANLIRSKGLQLAALNGALVSHLGQDRFKGIKTDIPGKLPSAAFINKYKIDTRLY